MASNYKPPKGDNVTLSISGAYEPSESGFAPLAIFSVEGQITDFDLSLIGEYQSPIYNQVNFALDDSTVPRDKYDYYPSPYTIVDFALEDDYVPMQGDSVLFELLEDYSEPTCKPDWVITPGDVVDFHFINCNSDDPDFVETLGDTVNFNFDCCIPIPRCDPDWQEQLGNAVFVDIDSCDGNPSFVSQPGNAVFVDFKCCPEGPVTETVIAVGSFNIGQLTASGEVDFTTRFEASGLFAPLPITVTGAAQFDESIITVVGTLTLPAIVAGVVERGARVTGAATLLPLVVTGDVLHSPENYLVNGSIQLGITVAASAQTFVPIEVNGDITLPISGGGIVLRSVDAEGIVVPLGIEVSGAVDITIVTVLPSSLVLEPVTASGDANYNLTPTANCSTTLPITVQGDVLYVALPTAWGDLNTGELTVSNGGLPVQSGALVYWANLKLDIPASGHVVTPIRAEGDFSIGEIKIDANVQVTVVGSTSQVNIGELKINRGWVHFGDPSAPEVREIYEASNARTTTIKEYPLDSRYPIYIPTTDYTIHNVELRRGTVEYTLEFNFDASQVEKIIVWVVDENGNSTKDTVARYVNGPSYPHEFNEPLKYLYALTIPVHCVNSKQYEFYLEVVYEDATHNGTVIFPRKSFLVPFQAHFDNRNPYFNATDRNSSIDAYFPSNQDGMLNVQSTDFAPITYAAEDTVRNVHLGNSENIQKLQSAYYELSKIGWAVEESASCHLTSILGSMQTKYFELDIGQIGG